MVTYSSSESLCFSLLFSRDFDLDLDLLLSPPLLRSRGDHLLPGRRSLDLDRRLCGLRDRKRGRCLRGERSLPLSMGYRPPPRGGGERLLGDGRSRLLREGEGESLSRLLPAGEEELLRLSRLGGEGEPLRFLVGDERALLLGEGDLSFFLCSGEGVLSLLLCFTGEGESFPNLLESFLCRGVSSCLAGDRDFLLTGECVSLFLR